ncbi:MAG: DUF4136 domain-containing protein [Flavobacteriaceae bacterium]
MKLLKFFTLIILIICASCSSIRVTTDYDIKANFTSYKTFAFHKKGIDEAKISDLDKKRIMRAIETELLAKGFTKSKNPDILVSIFTKSRDRVNVTTNNNFGWGWGWGWNPWMWGGMNQTNVNQYTEGTLFIDFIDKQKKELVWQGVGSGMMKFRSREKKEKRIKEFVKEIISKYPPQSE